MVASAAMCFGVPIRKHGSRLRWTTDEVAVRQAGLVQLRQGEATSAQAGPDDVVFDTGPESLRIAAPG